MKRFFKLRLAALGAILLMVGCGRDTVKVYHVDASDDVTQMPSPVIVPATPVATSNSMPMAMPPGFAALDNSGQPQLKYILPEGWQEKPASPMRVASFGISEDGKQADISVIPMGGMAGGATANVTRWRGQVGLAPMTDEEVAKLAEKISVGDKPADLYDIVGGGQRILAASYHREDTEWFFKMTGDADLVEKQKPAFVSFLKTIQFVPSAR